MNLVSVGKFEVSDTDTLIKVYSKYLTAMTGLEELSYLQIIWWFDKCDNSESRSKLVENKLFKKGLEFLGAFTAKMLERPNPIAVSKDYFLSVDLERGIIRVPYTDTFDGTPIYLQKLTSA